MSMDWKKEWSEEGGLEKYLNDPDGFLAGAEGARQPYVPRKRKTLKDLFKAMAGWWKNLP